MLDFRILSQETAVIIPMGGLEDEPLLLLYGGAWSTMSLRLKQQLAPMDSAASQAYLQGIVDMARHVNNVLTHQGLVPVGTFECDEMPKPMSGAEWEARQQ